MFVEIKHLKVILMATLKEAAGEEPNPVYALYQKFEEEKAHRRNGGK